MWNGVDPEEYNLAMVKYEVNKKLMGTYFDVGFPGIEEQAIEQAEKLKNKLLTILESRKILEIVERKKKEFEKAIESGEWIKLLPGRRIMKLFIGKYGKGLTYESFKNQLVHEIRERNEIPNELKDTMSHLLGLQI